MTADVKINPQTFGKISGNIGDAQRALDEQVLKDSNFYAPEDTGTLQDSAVMYTKIGSGVIVWQTPYAKSLYNGVGFEFSKDKNPNACAKWFERAKAEKSKTWERVANNGYYQRGQ